MKQLLLILITLALLTACTAPATQPTVEPTPAPPVETPAPPTEVIESDLPEPEPAPEPESEPIPEPEPEPEPWPFTADGPALTVGGHEIGISYKLDTLFYVPVTALQAHLELTAEPTDDGGVALYLHDRLVWVEDAIRWESAEGMQTHATAPVQYEGQWYLPTDALTPALGLTVLIDTQYPHVYVTDNRQYDPVPEGITVPVLMYHAIAETPRGNDELFVKPSELEAQLQYLADNGFTPVTFEDFPRLDEIEKPVMLTFDDGYDDNYTILYPLLQKYNMKATIFVITGYLNFDTYMTQEQANEVADSGYISIQSHTDSHPILSELDAASQQQELADSHLYITRITGKTPFALCYPTGRYNTDTFAAMEGYYSYGLPMTGNDYVTGQDPHLVTRYYVSRYTDLDTFARFICDAGVRRN